MSSYLYASSNAFSVNGEDYEVRIIETVAGTDSIKGFDVGPEGVNLIYESTDDTMLVPGIVSSRCEVSTIWPSEDTTLTSLIADLLDAEDGDFLLEILRDDSRIWVGSILVEQVDFLESTPTQTLRIVATDGLALLKNVDYNDDGTAYTGYQFLFDTILSNIQEKWVLWPYLDDENIGGPRMEMADDVYSTDDYIQGAVAHPASTNLSGTRRMRIHTHAWSQTDNDGNVTFINCYDLLQSICLTLQLRLYYYGNTWTFVPVNLSDQEVLGYTKNYDNTYSFKQIVGTYDFQRSAVNDIRQKDAAWVQSFTPQINKVKLTRDTNKGYEIISAFDVANGVSQTNNTLTFEPSTTADEDEAYLLTGSAYIVNTALSFDESERLGRFVLKFRIQFGLSGAAQYYKNEIVAHPAGRLENYTTSSPDFWSPDYAEFSFPEVGYNTTVGNYFYHRAENDAYYYDLNTASSRYLQFGVTIPSPPTEQTGVLITPIIEAYDSFGSYSVTATAALTTKVFSTIQLAAYSNNRLNVVPNFDYEATSTIGRGEINLGTTHIGALGVGMGRIEVQTGASTYAPTNNWVNQASDVARPINELCVEEVLAAHTKSKQIERGNIVLRGTSAVAAKPFSRFSDRDTGAYYTALDFQLTSTPGEMQVSLRKIGRDAAGVTSEATNVKDVVKGPQDEASGVMPGRPSQVMYGFNDKAESNFQGDWSSVIGSGETKEFYLTTSNIGQGRYIDDQGNTPASGKNIQRTVYVNTEGLALRTDSGWTSPAALQPAANEKLSDVVVLINNYVSKIGDHGAYTFMSTYDEVDAGLPLLNTYAGATGAYGLRRLRTAYTGNAIQVRRTTPTAASQDIGFNAQGELDTGALLAFCGSGDGYVQKWYNQATTGVDLQQTSTASQPKIFSAGSTILLNGKPAIEFDGSNDSLVGTANVNLNANVNELIAAWVGSVDSVSVGSTMVSHWNGTQANQVFQLQVQSNANMRAAHRYSNVFLGRADDPGTVADTQYVAVMHTKQNHHELYRNGSKTVGTKANVAPNDENTSFRVGARSDNQDVPHGGKTQEVVIWSRATAQNDADDISDSINDFYSAY